MRTNQSIAIYDSDSGPLRVQQIPGGYYAEVDNFYDLYFRSKKELNDYLVKVHADLVGHE